MNKKTKSKNIIFIQFKFNIFIKLQLKSLKHIIIIDFQYFSNSNRIHNFY